MKLIKSLFVYLLISASVCAQADYKTYLDNIKVELNKKWPGNRTVNIVYHGHSVPTGYYTGGVVHTFDAYPRLATKRIKEIYPYAVINTITTSIGGEKATQGVLRFVDDVLPMKPDVLFIDYALNDRKTPLDDVREAWEAMVDTALAHHIKVILCTPTPDTHEDILSDDAPLAAHAAQIRALAKEKNVGVIDSYQMFKDMVASGTALAPYMAQANHVNKLGHDLVAALIFEWFNNQEKEVYAHFKFDEEFVEDQDTVTKAEDNVLHANLAKASIVEDATRGKVLKLDADQGQAKLSADPIGEENFSISFWYNSAETRYWKYFMTFKEAQGRDLYGMNIQAWTSPNTLCFYRNTVKGYASSVSSLSTNQWYHVAMVVSNGSAQLYLNGQQKHAIDFSLEGYDFVDFYLGSDGGKTAATHLDDLMFYRAALSAADVKDIYDNQKEGTPSDLVAEARTAATFKTSVSNKCITIMPQQNFNWSDSTCNLYSTNGESLRTHNLKHSSDIDCSTLPQGIYVLQVGQESNTIVLQ